MQRINNQTWRTLTINLERINNQDAEDQQSTWRTLTINIERINNQHAEDQQSTWRTLTINMERGSTINMKRINDQHGGESNQHGEDHDQHGKDWQAIWRGLVIRMRESTINMERFNDQHGEEYAINMERIVINHLCWSSIPGRGLMINMEKIDNQLSKLCVCCWSHGSKIKTNRIEYQHGENQQSTFNSLHKWEIACHWSFGGELCSATISVQSMEFHLLHKIYLISDSQTIHSKSWSNCNSVKTTGVIIANISSAKM